MTEEVHSILTRPRRIRSAIKKINIQIEGLRMSMLPGAIQYDKDKVSSSGSGDALANYVSKLDELETNKNKLQEEYLEAQDTIVRICDVLDDVQSEIIMLRYISCRDFSEIADSIHLTERQMFRLYKDGLAKLSVNVSECQ